MRANILNSVSSGSGAGIFQYSGTGTLTLSGANIYGGASNFTNGTVTLTERIRRR